MRAFLKNNVLSFLVIFIISMFFVFDLFVHPGRPVTFDGLTHIANMAQVYEGLNDGDLPVRWGAGWARYGWPAPLFAQQVTSYVGAAINFVVQDIVHSYNVTVFLGAFLSTSLMYVFLRFYVGMYPALAASILFHLAPYRIMNVFIRGALPEFWASIFIILILIAVHLALEKKSYRGYLLLALSVALLLLTHPFMMVVSSFIFIPYGLWLLMREKNLAISRGVTLGLMMSLGIGLAAYFLLPLFLEVKYLYYGGSFDHFTPGHFLSIDRFFIDAWPYFTSDDIGPRGHVHIGGFVEGLLLLISTAFVGVRLLLRKKVHPLLVVSTAVAWLYILFMLPLTEMLYTNIQLLGNIQHPWRMMTGYIIVIPILAALLLQSLRSTQLQIGALFILLFAVSYLRFPELYGKNYTQYPEESYFITDDNMHGTQLNTIWMGEVRDYPYRDQKVEILDGAGRIDDLVVRNSSRSYSLNASSDVNIVDYTFYFPGWRVYVDGAEVPVQFQDPAQRGVITYQIPAGEYTVVTRFERTKVRLLAEVITVLSLIFFIILYTLRKRITRIIPYVV